MRRPNKYNAKKTSHAGYSFASAGELALFMELCLQQKCGVLKDLQVQDHVYMTDARILYIADFKAFDVERGEDVWMEFKGMETDVWRIKRRLWKFYGPGLLRVYKKSGKGIYLHETIVPARPKELRA